METMVEDYVPFEVSKLLKEKGFDAEIHMYWCAYTARPEEGYIERCPKDLEVNNNCSLGFRPDDFECIAPTNQMAMDWFRKEYKLNIVIMPVCTDDDGDGGVLWKFYVYRREQIVTCANTIYESYSICADDAIRYCLENLV